MPKPWEELSEAVQDVERILILLHDDPDPDAVASGVALRHLLQEVWGIESKVAYRGIIGRAENKALVAYLDAELLQLEDGDVETEWPVALVDVQPGAGNSPIPAGYPALVVIDHHSDRGGEDAVFRDVRPWIGASSTIVTQYMRAADLNPPAKIATGLFYGIKTDTKALSRDTSAADISAYFHLLPFVDVDAVVEIENAQVPAAYFRKLANAMQSASVYDGVVISYLGQAEYPDLTAEIADLLLRLEGIRWVVCMGRYDDEIYLSVRARDEDANAEEVAQVVVGEVGSAGGRNTMAGGQVPLNGQDPEKLAQRLRLRALSHLQIPLDHPGEPLVP
ncbi:MAG: bifunctional oligoribonuclease/PAP phosphatase NrnA [Candidatus Promineifilaceae bacterium]|nr:bifunctional oligoribonuclease/PAP phosphatase NrnA [Candidatus Promineifilaceae bacterium]